MRLNSIAGYPPTIKLISNTIVMKAIITNGDVTISKFTAVLKIDLKLSNNKTLKMIPIVIAIRNIKRLSPQN